MMAQRVPVARVLIAAPDAGDALQPAGLGQIDQVATAASLAAFASFLPALHRNGHLIELRAVVGMERAGAPVFGGGRTEFDALALREDALHRSLEWSFPHIRCDAERAAHANAGHKHAILARLVEGAEVEPIDRSFGVVEFLVDGNLFLRAVRFGEFRFASEHSPASSIQQFERVGFRRATAALAVLVHPHPVREIGALVRIVRTIARLDGMHREAARLARIVRVGESLF